MRAATEVSACLVCGSLRTARDPLGGVLRRCADCTFATTRAEIAAPADLYDDAYFHGAGYEDYLQPAARRHEAGVRLAWLRRTGGLPRTLVEAGSAAGFFVEACRVAGIAAEGVEVSATSAAYARDVLGVPVRHGAFETVELSPVDAVCAFHVLEHVEDPHTFLDVVRRVLRPGGRLLVEVPNIASPAARRQGAAWPGLQPEHHRWHFGPDSLARLVRDHGFGVDQQDTTVFRAYMPAHYRRHAGRRLIAPDVRNLRSLRLTHRTRGDLVRLTASLR